MDLHEAFKNLRETAGLRIRVRAIALYFAIAVLLAAGGYFYGLSHGKAITENQVTELKLAQTKEIADFMRWQLGVNQQVLKLAEEAIDRASRRDAFFAQSLNEIEDAINATPDPVGCPSDALDADELRHYNAGNRRSDAE